MEAPPPYMPPRKKSNTGLIIGLVIGGVVLCCIGPIAILGGGLLWGFNNVKPMLQCSATIQIARDAVRDYAKAHNGKLPKAETWMDDVRQYYQQEMSNEFGPFKPLPASAVWGCEDGSGGYTGLAFNSDLADVDENDVKREDVVLFEVRQAMANAHEKYVKASFTTSPKIFGEHRGWFVAFMDGAPGVYDKLDNFTAMETRGRRKMP